MVCAMALRALYEFTASPGRDTELGSYAANVRTEPGCVEAEAYRSVTDPSHVAVVQLWADQYAFSEHWRRSHVLDASEVARAEFYPHQYFDLDGAWVAQEHEGRNSGIVWPNSGSVRVLIQGSAADLDAALPSTLDNARETLREPGCLQFDWLRGIEFTHHTLLLELWQDQRIYDAHWQLRLKTGPSGPPPAAPRSVGSEGLEFYRFQTFIHLYDRWLPSDVNSWSETIVWAG